MTDYDIIHETLVKAHEWLEEHERLNTAPDGTRTGYIGLDHRIGENPEGCNIEYALAVLARLEAENARLREELREVRLAWKTQIDKIAKEREAR